MTFTEYYEYYLTLHQNKWCRRVHVLGQLMTVLFVTGCCLTTNYILLLLTPFVIYPFAWTGHFVFEGNAPAAFKKPLWAKACDWVMLKDIIVGRVKW